MKKLLFALIVLAQLPMSTKVFALSNEVKIDIATKQLIEALESADHQTVLKATQKLRSLDVNDIRLDFFDGESLYNLGDYRNAQTALEIYVSEAGREGEFYLESIDMLASLEMLLEGDSENQQYKNRESLGTRVKAPNTEISAPDLNFVCPSDTAQGFVPVQMMPHIYPAPSAPNDVSMLSYTCFYGENAQNVIALQFATGNASVACSNPNINPKASTGPGQLITNEAAKGLSSEQLSLITEQLSQPVAIPPVSYFPASQSRSFGFSMDQPTQTSGVEVLRVLDGSGAARSGLKRGHILLEINGDTSAVQSVESATLALQSSGDRTIVRVSDIETKEIAILVIDREMFIGPRPIMLTNNDLAVVHIEAPFGEGNELDYANWVDFGKKFFSYSQGKAIVCP